MVDIFKYIMQNIIKNNILLPKYLKTKSSATFQSIILKDKWEITEVIIIFIDVFELTKSNYTYFQIYNGIYDQKIFFLTKIIWYKFFWHFWSIIFKKKWVKLKSWLIFYHQKNKYYFREKLMKMAYFGEIFSSERKNYMELKYSKVLKLWDYKIWYT